MFFFQVFCFFYCKLHFLCHVQKKQYHFWNIHIILIGSHIRNVSFVCIGQTNGNIFLHLSAFFMYMCINNLGFVIISKFVQIYVLIDVCLWALPNKEKILNQHFSKLMISLGIVQFLAHFFCFGKKGSIAKVVVSLPFLSKTFIFGHNFFFHFWIDCLHTWTPLPFGQALQEDLTKLYFDS